VEIFSYCSNRYFISPTGLIKYNQTYVDSLPRLQPLQITIVPYNASSSSLLNSLNYLLGFDVVDTVFEFVTNVNQPYDFDTNQVQPVGLYYFLRHLPGVGRCTRGFDDRAIVGIGIGPAIIWTLAIIILVPMFFTLIWSPLGTFWMTVLMLIGFSGIVSLTLTVAWGYNLPCLTNNGGTAIILGEVFNILLAIPTLPEYAPYDIINTLNSIFNSSCGFFTNAYLLLSPEPPSPQNCSLCNSDGTADPSKKFKSCTSFKDIRITDYLELVKIELYSLLSPVVIFLQNSCLVRGGCFTFTTKYNINNQNAPKIPQNQGILSFIIIEPEQIKLLTTDSNSTSGLRLATCREVLWVSRIMLWIAIIIGLWIIVFLIFPFLVTVIIQVLLFLQTFLAIPLALILSTRNNFT
jgi:hypothetical protein